MSAVRSPCGGRTYSFVGAAWRSKAVAATCAPVYRAQPSPQISIFSCEFLLAFITRPHQKMPVNMALQFLAQFCSFRLFDTTFQKAPVHFPFILYRGYGYFSTSLLKTAFLCHLFCTLASILLLYTAVHIFFLFKQKQTNKN